MSTRFYGTFTLESMMTAAFGHVVDIQKGEPDDLTKAALNFSNLGRGKVLQVLSILLCKYDNLL